jgi:hypothetical protein
VKTTDTTPARGTSGRDRVTPTPSATAGETRTTGRLDVTTTINRPVVLVGDSLAVGIQALLPRLLPASAVTVDGRGGRPLAEGMTAISRLALPRAAVLAVSLFTNDDPANTGALSDAIGRSLAEAGPDSCVIWATIARPPVNGVSYAAANAVLKAAVAQQPTMRLVPWAEQMRAHPELLSADGVHPTPAGYELRAQLYAQAATSCP